MLPDEFYAAMLSAERLKFFQRAFRRGAYFYNRERLWDLMTVDFHISRLGKAQLSDLNAQLHFDNPFAKIALKGLNTLVKDAQYSGFWDISTKAAFSKFLALVPEIKPVCGIRRPKIGRRSREKLLSFFIQMNVNLAMLCSLKRYFREKGPAFNENIPPGVRKGGGRRLNLYAPILGKDRLGFYRGYLNSHQGRNAVTKLNNILDSAGLTLRLAHASYNEVRALAAGIKENFPDAFYLWKVGHDLDPGDPPVSRSGSSVKNHLGLRALYDRCYGREFRGLSKRFGTYLARGRVPEKFAENMIVVGVICALGEYATSKSWHSLKKPMSW